MTTNMYIPFTYHIAWTKHNLHYYGVRYAQGTTPKDLWNPYKTSSKAVKTLIESIGEPDTIEVRKEFKTQEEAKEWEYRVLKRLGATKRDDWINECAFPLFDFVWKGKKHSEETKKKMSIIKQGSKHPLYGKPRSEKTKKLISIGNKGNKNSLGSHRNSEQRKNITNNEKSLAKKKTFTRKISIHNG